MAVNGKARAYGLHTDSSHRFERGVDPYLQARAIERATGLLCEIAGGDVGPIVEAANTGNIEERPLINLRSQRVCKVLGVDIDPSEIIV